MLGVDEESKHAESIIPSPQLILNRGSTKKVTEEVKAPALQSKKSLSKYHHVQSSRGEISYRMAQEENHTEVDESAPGGGGLSFMTVPRMGLENQYMTRQLKNGMSVKNRPSTTGRRFK
jgi:hypothetical protein